MLLRSTPLSTTPVHHAIADDLLAAEQTRNPIAPLTETHPGLTVEDAYAIQSINAATLSFTKGGVAGYKVGLTSTGPQYGHLYRDRLHAGRIALKTDALIAPRVEPQIAFVLGRDLCGPDVTPADVLEATEHVVPALEVLDSRMAGWTITLVDSIADNASCASVVLGDRRTPPTGIPLAAVMAELRVDGETVQAGAGAAVLGHPAKAVAWLVNEISRHGTSLEAGHIVMPGAMTAAIPLQPGTTVTGDFGDLGTVEAVIR